MLCLKKLRKCALSGNACGAFATGGKTRKIMNNALQHEKIHIGTRGIKTAITAALCTLLYLIFDRNPTFACIGVVFGTGSDLGNSWLNGGNRLFGTIFGGLIGMGLFSIYLIFYPDGGFHPLMIVLVFIGVILLILMSLIFHWPGAVQPGGVMLCILLFNQPATSYIPYSLNRIFDTAVGVALALLVSYLLPKERLLAFAAKFQKKRNADMDADMDINMDI